MDLPSEDIYFINIPDSLKALKKLCKAIRNNSRINKESQRLSRNLSAHTQVIAFLKFISEIKDNSVDHLHKAAHTFLQDFCEGNTLNQQQLSQDLDFLMV